jgi:hypothetical protein
MERDPCGGHWRCCPKFYLVMDTGAQSLSQLDYLLLDYFQRGQRPYTRRNGGCAGPFGMQRRGESAGFTGPYDALPWCESRGFAGPPWDESSGIVGPSGVLPQWGGMGGLSNNSASPDTIA